MKSGHTVQIEGVNLRLAHPDELPMRWVGQDTLIKQLLACWLMLDEKDIPLNPRLIGKPGVGKTTLAYAAGKTINREVYIFQATMDTRPEDLLITPVISAKNEIQYVASSLVTAMIRGGVAVLDEGNRMSEKSWASLAPLLDSRRYVESLVAGVKIQAHPDFRMVVTMNDDASTYEIPEYIHSRIQPQIFIDFPDRDEELMILKENLPFVSKDILKYVVTFLQHAHEHNDWFTVRDGINISRYAAKIIKSDPKKKNEAIAFAIGEILGEDALRYLQPDRD